MLILIGVLLMALGLGLYLKLGGRRHGTGGGGGTTPIIATYDTRFGVTDASTGWITFPLNSGNRRVWVGPGGNDANDGLSYATRKLTFDAAWAVYKTGTGGDQLMIGSGATYTDGGANGTAATLPSGPSKAYPNAILSFDSADPTNEAKYGRMTGADMPKLLFPTSGVPTLAMAGNTGSGNFAIQGLAIINSTDANSKQLDYNGGAHDGLCFQNMRLIGVSISVYLADAPTTHEGALLSKCALVGAWATTGNKSDFFLSGTDGMVFEDCIFASGGNRVSVPRSADMAVGGANIFGHGAYMHSGNINAKVRRCVYVDSAADGFNARGSVSGECVVSIDEPYAGVIGGTSSSYSEPTSTVTLDDFAVLGADTISFTNPRSGGGFNNQNTNLGSYVKNGVMTDNPLRGGTNNAILAPRNANPNSFTLYLTFDGVVAYNYSANGFGALQNTYPCNVTVQNCILDALPGAGYTTSNNSVWTPGQFPNAVDRPAIATALGFTGATWPEQKAKLVNAMLWRPDLPWAQAILSITLPAFGKSLTKAPAVSPPDMSAETPDEIYVVDGIAPTLSSPTASGNGVSGQANISVTTNEATGTIFYAVTTSATPPTPGAAALKQGGWSIGVPNYKAKGVILPSATGVQTATGISGSMVDGTTYYVHFMHEDLAGNWSAIASTAGFTTAGSADTTAPVLSAATATATSSTTADLAVSSDESNGTLYMVVTTSSTPPTAAQVRLGQDNSGATAAWSGNQPVTVTGEQDASATGLSAGTAYTAHYMQQDTAGNQSAVVSSAAFTTAAALAAQFDFIAGTQQVGGTSYGSLASVPGWTHTHSGNLSVLDSDGGVDTFAANVLPLNGLGLHSYGAVTNYLRNSQNAGTTGGWNLSNTTATNDTDVAPDGATTADTLTTSNVVHYAYITSLGTPATAGLTYTASFFAKRGTMTDAKWSVRTNTTATVLAAQASYYAQINGSTFSRVVGGFTNSTTEGHQLRVLYDSGVTGTTVVWQMQSLLGSFGCGGPIVPTTTAIVTTGATTTSFALANGTYNATYTMDDGSTKTLSQTVSSGVFTLAVADGTATNLPRGRIKSLSVA